MSKKFFLPLFFLFGLMAFYATTAVTQAQSPTIPTRTPVSQPTAVPPTSAPATLPPDNGGGGDNGGGDNGGGNNPPPATNTPVPPANTATPTRIPPTPTASTTPMGGFITPEPCGDALFLASNGPVNVRQEPTTAARLLDQLVLNEARPIIGRYVSDQWWLIRLADGTEGWVADFTGQTYGYTTLVPVLDRTKAASDTAANWTPTQDPSCPDETPTPTPTATATATATLHPTVTASATPATAASQNTTSPTPQATAEAENSTTSTNENNEDTAENPSQTATPTTEPTAIVQANTPVPAAPSNTDTPNNLGTGQANTATTPINTNAENGGSTNWLLISGITLILGGFGYGIYQRTAKA